MSTLRAEVSARSSITLRDLAAGLGIVAVFALFLRGALHYSDGDMIWLQMVGQSIVTGHGIPAALTGTFTADGARWTPHDWFLGVLLALSHRLVPALTVSAAATLALCLAGVRAWRRRSSPFALACVLAWTAASFAGAFGIRGQVLAWPFLAALMLVLDEDSPSVLWIFLILAAWANVHASAVAGAGLVLLRAATRIRARSAAMAAAACAAIFVTPLLWRMPVYAFTAQFDANGSHKLIAEWHHPTLAVMQFAWGLIPLLIFASYGIVRRKRWSDIVPSLLFLAAAAMSIRHIPLCAIVIAPLAAEGLTASLHDAARIPMVRLVRDALAVAVAVVAVFSTSKVVSYDLAARGIPMPVRAVADLSSVPGEHRLFCQEFAWCATALRTRNVRDFLDGRADPFPRRVWHDYAAIRTIRPGWSALAARYGIDAFLTWPSGGLDRALANDARWRLLYASRRYHLYVAARKN